MDAKSDINCVTKWCGMYALLTIVMAMATMGKLSKSAIVDTAIVLDCPQHGPQLVVWNVRLNNGTYCYLSYTSRGDLKDKNCSENVNWLSRPEQLPSLQIKSPQISSEGIYMCSVAHTNGTFVYEYSLTVLVPPELSLTNNLNGTLVCKAVAGKPTAQISWSPTGDYETEVEGLFNGTETVTSAYNVNVTSANEDEVTCIVSHPAWKEDRILTLSLGTYNARRTDTTLTILYSSLICLLGLFIPLLFIYLWRFFHRRKTDVNELKNPETVTRRLSFQENETQPYATFVQVENVIYDKTSDFSPEFSSST
ncbi:cell surface glycoprotein CD200 receptor 1 [Sceloporus undulatus]|uniref:cell surface glycoprotein CD200 receptor 1 n=1 Tax=Sceloporus undulatus TaxID=8520 RepID=UPI001C4DD0F3|nr:cell surface glycoprotein CD200 receptor 1 [Sceloporus undulatus]